MAKIRFVSTTVKEEDLLSRDRLSIGMFKAWQIERRERMVDMAVVLRKYMEGSEMWPKKKAFNFLDYHREQTPLTERTYFKPSQVISIFRKMSASEINKMYDKINDGKKKLRGQYE